ncbi:endo-1,4-beta-xylanase [Paenibacillus lentus]|uniref:Beta-xylanase n=1 Tax=Paenibacillus lentus TaxID=1338368 RepID=A0A3Q8SB03_9BACL|nr:endo-1,4-beta-xylanase [Paenibacillus lentus]AZK46397.1 hypothetical protein EIM92_09610 [Paenibacillus lentus]
MSDVIRNERKLKEIFAGSFQIGAAVNPRTIQSQEELLAYHFNSITAENEMKFVSLQPEEGIFTFEEADPSALLFYNDYNESNPLKREKIYRLLQLLLDQGAPIHGVGLQAHWNLYGPSLDDIRAAIEKYASLGLQLQLTELDVSMFAFDDKRTDLKEAPPELIELQAQRYEQLFKLLKEYRDVISSVTFWGAADDYTWLDNFPVCGRKNWPFLFDEHHQPKPAFHRVAELAGS